ncbi:MAG TPA: class I SAM-dependent DNA methyltransferase [Verrucomicrobia bacterium]|nr:class I SAM-dependent DNA methyltransferase [Verrucomicrobiota bacterium]
MTINEFITKWRKVELKERSAAQEHFLDLCRVFDHPTPAAADPTGEMFCFEKGTAKHGGGEGFADVWKKDFFGWEYKGKHKDLTAAYDQLLRYRDALASPPLLVLCDMNRIVVRTNFTGTVSAVHEIALESLGDPRNIEIMRAVFHHPEALRPGRTSIAVTQDAARQIAEIADILRKRGNDPAAVAHFLDRIVFCLFAEDAGLLPDNVFTRILEKSGGEAVRFGRLLGQLFETMATGGDFGLELIRHFNGSLFDDQNVLELTADDVKRFAVAAALDWSAVDPSIFGTLFERGLDPAKRSQLGAHFTSRDDIELVVDAVMMSVLRREWDEIKAIIECLLTTGKKRGKTTDCRLQTADQKPLSPAAKRKAQGEAASILHRFLDRLQHVKVLDPSCGSGNFLYVALLRLKDLEKEVILFGSDNGLGAFLPMVGPWQLYGIEVNPYAHDLAQMTVWIGWLQWIRANGFGFPADPVLRSLAENIRLMDAILPDGAGGTPAPPGEPAWPSVDFIVGNPPFLGGNRIRQELGDDYVDRLFALYDGRVPAFADLCCYWFEKARAHIADGKCKRAGLLATQGIRGGANRDVLKRIQEGGGIFWAESDRPWVLDGANVRVSMVAFDNGTEPTRILDGREVPAINPNLTSCADITMAKTLSGNQGICFMGPSAKAPFDIDGETAAVMLAGKGNPNGKPNSDVVRPVISAVDIGQGSRGKWTIDFALMPIEEAAQYEKPFEYVRANVLPVRETRRDDYRGMWWQYARPRPEMRSALQELSRYIATPGVSKHRLFVWVSADVLCNQGTLVFARDDDAFFGILHSRIHEVWALSMGTRLEDRPRYTPTTSFETFPLPGGAGVPPASCACAAARDGADGTSAPLGFAAIAEAARDLVVKRDRWLNPEGITAAERKTRTLTKLYNARPQWLADCHARLDTVVAAAYGWPANLTDDAILERLLALNQAQAGASR